MLAAESTKKLVDKAMNDAPEVFGLLGAATGLSKEEVLAMVGRAAKPLVQRKLEELGVQPEDVAIVSTAIEKLVTEDNKQKLQAVFAAAMPLVQGSVTVSKVEALLGAATGLSNKETYKVRVQK